MNKKRAVVLISGSGTNLQALIDACEAPDYPVEIAGVISNKAEAYGLERAGKSGIPAITLSHKDYASREAFDAALDKEIRKLKGEIVCLAGFMRLLTPGFVTGRRGAIINIHPSLLPAFKGAHAQKDALREGAAITGCTVHYVVPEMDAGPIIAQAATVILPGDTEATLRERMLKLEHRCYVQALEWVANGKSAIDAPRPAITPEERELYSF